METNRRYYELMWSDPEDDDDPGGVAYAPGSFELWLEPHSTLLTTWNVPTFQLRDGSFTDYLANNKGLPMCSEHMREIIETHRGQADLLEWLPVEVHDVQPGPAGVGGEEQQSRHYAIPHLLEELDVVDTTRSIMASTGFVVKPHLILAKIGAHQIFRYRGGGDMTICMSNKLRLALLEWGCTGCHFWEIPAS